MLNRYEVSGTYEGKQTTGEYICHNPEEAGDLAFRDGLLNVKILLISPLENITLECED